ncbi:MAG: putative toxin-antitoxin system toxin component, PIN family [Actinobacteria bacterium]|nr:putative toxin-antitoxin system toxin component, PIN family [Actinomycetota bacterium]MBL7123363.1 putative toxin-antitoxin system toxin component, PIN family [Actinomycetota bacterium]
MKIVLDTNIYISAAVFGRLCEEVIQFCRFDKISVYISEDIIDEIENKLIVKFSWKENQIRVFLENILEFCKIVEVEERIVFIKEDPDDDKILECAVSAKCEYIVSGDKHLINLKSYKNIKILKPADFLFLIKK